MVDFKKAAAGGLKVIQVEERKQQQEAERQVVHTYVRDFIKHIAQNVDGITAKNHGDQKALLGHGTYRFTFCPEHRAFTSGGLGDFHFRLVKFDLLNVDYLLWRRELAGKDTDSAFLRWSDKALEAIVREIVSYYPDKADDISSAAKNFVTENPPPYDRPSLLRGLGQKFGLVARPKSSYETAPSPTP